MADDCLTIINGTRRFIVFSNNPSGHYMRMAPNSEAEVANNSDWIAYLDNLGAHDAATPARHDGGDPQRRVKYDNGLAYRRPQPVTRPSRSKGPPEAA